MSITRNPKRIETIRNELHVVILQMQLISTATILRHPYEERASNLAAPWTQSDASLIRLTKHLWWMPIPSDNINGIVNENYLQE